MKHWAEIEGGFVIATGSGAAVPMAPEGRVIVEVSEGAAILGGAWDGENFAAPVREFAYYTWGQFIEAVFQGGNALAIRQEMNQQTDRGYNLMNFYELGASRGFVDFADQWSRDVIDALVPDVSSQSAVDALIGR